MNGIGTKFEKGPVPDHGPVTAVARNVQNPKKRRVRRKVLSCGAHVSTGTWHRDPSGMGHGVLCIKSDSFSCASEKAQEEPPAKLLDDLFRKTKAAPCIYWLPLTDSQVRAGLPALLRAAARLGPKEWLRVIREETAMRKEAVLRNS